MIPSRTVADRVRLAFQPTPLGVVGLTDQLLAACAGSAVVFERVGERCVYRWTADGDTQEGTVPFAPTAFRSILARIAVLCQESCPESVTPYRGEGSLPVPGHPSEQLRVRFVNTPEQQQLTLIGVGQTELVEEQPRAERPGAETWTPEVA